MKLQIILSSVSILFLIGAVFLGLMVLAGKIDQSVHIMIAFLAVIVSITSHAKCIGGFLKK